MRVLILSDSHMYNDILMNILDNIQCDCIVHCGDSIFQKNDPLLEKMYVVRGNHDLCDLPINQTVNIYHYKCLITHGHFYHIYEGYEELYKYMKANEYDICFHGHTHVPHIEHYQDKLMINPGSIMFNRGSSECGSFAIAEFEDHHINVKFYNSQTFEQIPKNVIDEGQHILDEFKYLLKDFHAR